MSKELFKISVNLKSKKTSVLPKIVSNYKKRLLLTFFAFWLIGCGTTSTSTQKRFAERIELVGVERLARLNQNLYRGAQPTEEGFSNLKALGIKTIINLRSDNTEEKVCRRLCFAHYHIKTETDTPPKAEQVRQFMQIATNSENQPVFFHCQFGADRTGMMAALYRVLYDEWSNEEAISEMEYFGFHGIWYKLKGYVKNFKASSWQ